MENNGIYYATYKIQVNESVIFFCICLENLNVAGTGDTPEESIQNMLNLYYEKEIEFTDEDFDEAWGH